VAFVVASVLGCTWIIWAQPELEITQDYGLNPVVRLVGGPTVTLVALTPLLLEQAFAPRRDVGRSPEPTRLAPYDDRMSFRGAALPWAIVAAAALAYPLSMAVGYSGLRLPGGPPAFPTARECAEAPVRGAPVRVVLAHVESFSEAQAIRRRATRGGLGRTSVEQDGCGRLRVFVDDVRTEKEARALTERALVQGLRPSIELDPDD